MSDRGTTAEAATISDESAGRRDLVSLGLLGALAFVVTADARVVDPLLPVIADDFTTSIDRAGKLRVMGAATAVFAFAFAFCLSGVAVVTLAAIFAMRVLNPASARFSSSSVLAP